jgi:hypothetical protein
MIYNAVQTGLENGAVMHASVIELAKAANCSQ